MTLNELIILQLIAHVLSDFFLQNDFWIRHRSRYRFRSRYLYFHSLIVFILSWVLSFRWKFVLCALAIALSHLILDGFKSKIVKIKIGRNKIFKNAFFFIDQILHLVVIVSAIKLFEHISGDTFSLVPFDTYFLFIILSYLVCLKPTNVFIREMFGLYRLKTVNTPGEDLLNAGKLIGNIERLLILTLMIFGYYEVIGFIIAGKSILRFEGTKTAKTEYVLIGTLLSFGIAILIGILIQNDIVTQAPPFLDHLKETEEVM